MFDLLATRPAVDRRLVLLALQARLGDGDAANSRQERIVAALRRCAADLGHAPSRRDWDTWRARQNRPQDWPSASAIRNAFGGSWSRARHAAGGQPSPAASALRLTAQGASYTDKEMLAALLAAGGENLSALTFEGYVRWARARAPRLDGPRTPRSGKPFRRRWGSWAQAMEAAAEAAGTTGNPRSRAWGKTYGSEVIIDALMEATADVKPGPHGLTFGQYDRWARTHPLGRPRPRAATVARHFGSWAHALEAAGLLGSHEARQRAARVGTPHSDEELVAWLCRAVDECGQGVTRASYASWRRLVIACREPGDPIPPSDATLRLRLGGWGSALTRAGR